MKSFDFYQFRSVACSVCRTWKCLVLFNVLDRSRKSLFFFLCTTDILTKLLLRFLLISSFVAQIAGTHRGFE